MRLALISCFDIGASYGIGDDAFPSEVLNRAPAILQVGIRNPLGVGVGCALTATAPALVAEWRRAAESMLERKEMELGWTSALEIPEKAFRSALVSDLQHHRITKCELAICAVGTVLLWLEFDEGLPPERLAGVSTCFEFAAYTPAISDGLRRAALARVHEVIGQASNPLAELSRRPEPAIETDPEGYRESRLIPSFTRLLLCIDPTDSIAGNTVNGLDLKEWSSEPVVFEYHGTLHFGWASCVIVPKNLHDQNETPPQQIARMLECIRIAHVFLGTCEALERLTVNEIFRQVGDYVNASGGIRNARDLNRLRTLALATVSLTSFTAVASAEEDQRYFALFEGLARIEPRNKTIQNRCDILYSVQLAEAQAEKDEQDEKQAQQDRRLSYLLAAIAGLTLISVLADSYNFYKGSEPDLLSVFSRGVALGGLLGAILIGALVVPRLLRAQRRKQEELRRAG